MGFMQSSDSFCNIALVTLSLYPLNNPFTFIVTIVGCSTKLLYFLPAIPTRCPMWWLPNLSWDLVHHCSVSFPMKPQFHHVKSHQDNNTDCPLQSQNNLRLPAIVTLPILTLILHCLASNSTLWFQLDIHTYASISPSWLLGIYNLNYKMVLWETLTLTISKKNSHHHPVAYYTDFHNQIHSQMFAFAG